MSSSPMELILFAVVAAGILTLLWKRFGGQRLSREQILAFQRQGAVVLDVRSAAEYAGGQSKGSKNIPLGELPARLGEVPKGKVILTCCASGMRSGLARNLLLKEGFTEVHNAGAWQNLC